MNLNKLTQALQTKVPNGALKIQSLPQAPRIKLALIEDTYPQHTLTPEQAAFLMDEPPYWAFCWASGQVLANYLLSHPNWVEDKTVVDFGCGSGVVAIAAKLAGAERCVALDIDEVARLASETNADLNEVDIEVVEGFESAELDTQNSILLIADVFYDEENIPMLSDFLVNFQTVIVADSRVKPASLKGLSEVARYASSTVPDLGESTDFNSVGIYQPL